MEGELRMPLTGKWFEMSKTVKKEDYREITPYWAKRLVGSWKYIGDEKGLFPGHPNTFMADCEIISFKKFDTNVMTLGYPKKGDEDKILRFEHKGIEIRTGKPEWGAEEGKLYFVIMHGKRCVKEFKVVDHEEVKTI